MTFSIFGQSFPANGKPRDPFVTQESRFIFAALHYNSFSRKSVHNNLIKMGSGVEQKDRLRLSKRSEWQDGFFGADQDARTRGEHLCIRGLRLSDHSTKTVDCYLGDTAKRKQF